jgi:replicative DNA helicase
MAITDTFRALPSKPEAEKAVLTLALQSPEWETELAFHGFRSEWLHIPAHRRLWAEIAWIREQRPDEREVDALALQSRLIALGALEVIGGPATLLEIVGGIAGSPSPENAAFYAGVLRQEWQRREAIATCSRLLAVAYMAGGSFDHDLSTALTSLAALSAPSASSKLVNGADVLREFITSLEEAYEAGDEHTSGQPISTGIPELDEKIGGLIPDLWLIGAETSAGKTVLAMQLVRAVLRAGQRALVFPLEMTAMKLVRRVVAAESRIPMSRLMHPRKLGTSDWPKLVGPGSDWNAKMLTIYDDSDLHIQDVRAIARGEHAKEPLGCVLLDYVQLATAGRFRDQANREQEISFIGAECKKMSNELGIPVIAPTQLNDDGKVRESRALKHHAGVYLVIESDAGRILCAKNRDGERDWSMPYKLVGDIQTFER